MKSLINTLVVAVALAVSATPSLAAAVEMSGQPVSQSESDTHNAAVTTSSVPFFALNRLDVQSLAAQEMADQELKGIEGGYIYVDLGWMFGGPMIIGDVIEVSVRY